jgi:hypothetical protein
LNAWLDGFMKQALATGDIAGAVVVVVKDGQILAIATLSAAWLVIALRLASPSLQF